MKNSTGIALSLSGLLAMLFLLAFLYSTSFAGVVDDVLPVDKDKVLEPIIGERPNPNEVVLKPEPIIVSPLTDQQAQDIRKEWNDALGVDVWGPYYLFQEFENMIRNHLRIKLGPFVGRPNFNYHTRAIEYRFVWRF